MVLEIIISQFSCNLKMMPRTTFPEHQPDSASYGQNLLQYYFGNNLFSFTHAL